MKLNNSNFASFDIDGYIPPIEFLVSTTSNGLLYFNGRSFIKILDISLCYGITKHNDDWWVAAQDNEKGKILSFNIRDQKGYNLRVRIDGLSKAIHQIDFVGNELVIADTLKNRILTFRSPFSDKILGFKDFASWLTPAKLNGHMNSIYATDSRMYVLAHNQTYKTGSKSDILVFDRHFNRINEEDVATNCSSAHNFYKDECRELICDSEEGTLLCNNKVVFKCDEKSFTRGLSVAHDYILVGSSGISPIRNKRNHRTGYIYVLDSIFNKIGKIGIDKTQIMDIRRIDAPDMGLSNNKVVKDGS